MLRQRLLSRSLSAIRISSTRFCRNLSTTDISKLSWIDRRAAINSVFTYISNDSQYKTTCKEKSIDSRNWNAYLNNNRRLLIKDPEAFFRTKEEMKSFQNAIDEVAQSSSHQTLKNNSASVFNYMLERAEQDLRFVIIANRTLSASDNLSKPPLWFPLARMMKRKIIYHGGPTNSGKTYHAIERLKNIDKSKGGGIYCGPLRLLALEVYEKLNKAGVMTNLRTGQETRIVPGAYHTASTVEMVSLTQPYDVAVIDEIQMIGDQHRGSAWTRALLGLRANEIHVCGGLEAADLVRSLCASTGDEFILQKYERLSPIEVESESLRGDYSKVQKGDCIVAFTVQDLFLIRREIESKTPFKCAIINGKLPSETKSNQAKLFNEDDSGYDILIATDAIGMGLNLNIRRIIFHSTLKRNGSSTNSSLAANTGTNTAELSGPQQQQMSAATTPFHVDPILVKQIAGRAGRKSSNYNVGKVTTWQEFDLAYVRAVVQWDIPSIPAAGIAPDVAQIQLFYEQIKRLFASTDTQQDAAATVATASSSTVLTSISRDSSSNTFGSNRNKSTLIDEILLEGEHHGSEDMLSISRTTSPDLKNDADDVDLDDKSSDKNDSDDPAGAATTKSTDATLEASILTAESVDNIRLSLLVERFLEATSMDARYFLCNQDTLYRVSNYLHPIPMTVTDRFTFASAPTNIRSPMTMQHFYRYAAMYALNRPVLIGFPLKRAVPKTLEEFTDLCEKHNTIDLYLWLSAHFPKSFLDFDNTLRMKLLAVSLIEEYLSSDWAMSSANKRESVLLSSSEKRNRMRDNNNNSSSSMNNSAMLKVALEAQIVMARRYMDLRNKLLGKHGSEDNIELLLPPYAPELRDITRSYLLSIPKTLYYVEPPSAADAQAQISTDSRNARNHRNSKNRRANLDQDSPDWNEKDKKIVVNSVITLNE